LKNQASKAAMKYLNWFFFPYCPELPKQPKERNSWRMWLIDRLYIKLGIERYVLGAQNARFMTKIPNKSAFPTSVLCLRPRNNFIEHIVS
jgi:hypothetical protein